jgi:hydroxymethylpyrimidine/phosphomethylpyrimidine kinase
VVDPVLVSKNKKKLLSDKAVKSMITRLFPKAILVTPNIPEAEILTRRKINNIGDMEAAARSLIKLGPKNVLIKGGHLGNTGISGKRAIDILYDGKSFKRFEDALLPTRGVHGTGCIYSAAITTELAKGNDLAGAIRKSKEFISKVIAESVRLGKGYALMNYSQNHLVSNT